MELQDDNGDIVGYTTIELFGHQMDQYVQPEDVAAQDPWARIWSKWQNPGVLQNSTRCKEHPWIIEQNETIDEATLIRLGLNQFKEHIDFKLYVIKKHGSNYHG